MRELTAGVTEQGVHLPDSHKRPWGIVLSVGPDVSDSYRELKPGDRVCWLHASVIDDIPTLGSVHMVPVDDVVAVIEEVRPEGVDPVAWEQQLDKLRTRRYLDALGDEGAKPQPMPRSPGIAVPDKRLVEAGQAPQLTRA